MPLEGDYVGNPVNVAARLIGAAEHAGIAAARTFIDALGSRAPATTDLGGFDLKGVGRVEALRVARRGIPRGRVQG